MYVVFAVLYMAVIPLANWMIGNVGTVCVPNGPCLIPVWPGVLAPSGLVLAAFALVLRDLVQLTVGVRVALYVVLMGTLLSALVAPPALVLASAGAFLVSELIDTAVYTPLQKRGLTLAVLASGLVGIVVDSVLFLWLAFGSMDHLLGQIIGKGWAILFAAGLIHLSRRYLVPARIISTEK